MYRDVNRELSQFTGTQRYYRTHGGLYTDGIHHLIEKYNCYWLMQDIFIYLCSASSLREEDITVWSLQRVMKVDKDSGAVLERKDIFILSCEDGNGNVLFSQAIPFSDFEGDSIKLYFENGVLYLPSER